MRVLESLLLNPFHDYLRIVSQVPWYTILYTRIAECARNGWYFNNYDRPHPGPTFIFHRVLWNGMDVALLELSIVFCGMEWMWLCWNFPSCSVEWNGCGSVGTFHRVLWNGMDVALLELSIVFCGMEWMWLCWNFPSCSVEWNGCGSVGTFDLAIARRLNDSYCMRVRFFRLRPLLCHVRWTLLTPF